MSQRIEDTDTDTSEYVPGDSPVSEIDDYQDNHAISSLPDINEHYQDDDEYYQDDDEYYDDGDQDYEDDQVSNADDGSSDVMEDGKEFPSVCDEADAIIQVLESTPGSFPEELLQRRFEYVASNASVAGRYDWNDHSEGDDDLDDGAYDNSYMEWDPQAECEVSVEESVEETVGESIEEIVDDTPSAERPELLRLDPRQSRNSLEQTFLNAHLDDHVLRLSKAILDAELRGPRSPLHRMAIKGRQTIVGTLVCILASANWHVVKDCITGELASEMKRSRSHSGEAVRYMTNDSAPGIYANYMTDASGRSPTAEQYLEICEDLEDYSSMSFTNVSNLWRASVDQVHCCPASWTVAQNRAGYARYLDWWPVMVKKSGEHSKRRREVVARLVKELRERCLVSVQKGLGKQPLSPPLVEIGYSIRPASRLRQHASHRSSNYLMNLTEALLKKRYQIFGLTQGVIFKVWDSLQPWLAEIAFTQLAQGYISQAGGFSHFPAGFSNSSAWKKLSMAQWAELVPKREEHDLMLLRIEAATRLMRRNKSELKPLTEMADAMSKFRDSLADSIGTGREDSMVTGTGSGMGSNDSDTIVLARPSGSKCVAKFPEAI